MDLCAEESQISLTTCLLYTLSSITHDSSPNLR